VPSKNGASTNRVVIIGASGQLGSDLMSAFADCAPVGVDHKLVDIEVPAAVTKMLVTHRPDLVINTAAFHNVELCETRPDRALAVNALAVDGLAGQCAAAGAVLLHISTDYVFDGAQQKPYAETDPTNPLNAYGISKLAGEHLVWRNLANAYVIRTSGLYGIRGSSTKGYTFIERMLTQAAAGKPIRVVTDVESSPSYTRDVARTIRRIVDSGRYGTYHVSNAGQCSWYDFAVEILRQANFEVAVGRTTASEFPSLARRPAYSALAHSGLERLGLEPMPDWRAGIAAYLEERRQTSRAV
jgi:dTDP-4-dehydrorhamnose reductase